MANIIKTGKNVAVHGILLSGKTGKFSAYYENGVLVDAEQLWGGRRGSKSVKKDGPIWFKLANAAKVYCHDDDSMLP